MRVGVSKRTLQDWEAGIKIARPKNLSALALELGVPPGWFHDSDLALQTAVAEVVSDLEGVYTSLGRTLDRLKVLAASPLPKGLSLVSESGPEFKDESTSPE